MASPQPVLQFDVEYPDRPLNRLTTFFRGILIIPHWIVLYALGAVVSVTTFLAFFAILFTGRYPQGLFNLAMLYYRWLARVNSYWLYMRDEYPPFGDGPYPIRIELDYPESLSHWKIFLKGIFAIPHLIVLALLSLVMLVLALAAWFVILFTGRYPRGIFNFNAGVLRWALRVSVYVSLLTDAYPPFTLQPVASPTGGMAGMPA
jgi:hypothetical protein